VYRWELLIIYLGNKFWINMVQEEKHYIMIERHINRKSGWRRKTVFAALAAVILITLPEPVKVLAAGVQSYGISVEELQVVEPEELPEYGAVKTADANNGTAIWLAVLLLGIGGILDKVYLTNRKDEYD